MKTLMLEVDDEIMSAYQNFSSENKKQLNINVCLMIKKVANSARSVKLKKLIDELKNEMPESEMNQDILVELLREQD